MKYGEVRNGQRLDGYSVNHPEFGATEVVALSGENAIQLACREWGVSWGLHACDCDAVKLAKAEKHICVRCGFEVHTAGERMCNSCRCTVAAEKRQYFRNYPVKRERA